LRNESEWIRAHVEPTGPIEATHVRPWATVLCVPVEGGVVWFKACAPVQAFEPHLSAGLAARWPDRVAEVLGHDEERAWLLLADAGTPLIPPENPPEPWLDVLPRYAELQRGEAEFAADHLAHGVPDLRVATLPARYAELVRRDLPVEPAELARLRAFAPTLAELCAELAGCGPPATIQHDDLHMGNVYRHDGRISVLDWGDSSVAHPFLSMVVTLRFLDEVTGLPPDDPWYARLRDAYLEPWGGGFRDVFALAMRVGAVAHAIAWTRQRDHLPGHYLPTFDRAYRLVLRRAIAAVPDPGMGVR
jgi:hypothetical protein